MTVKSICTVILFYFIARASFAGTCETFKGASDVVLCWHRPQQAFLSETCLKKACEAEAMLKQKIKLEIPTPVGGQNPAAQICHALKQSVVVLRDQRGNEQSFCQFSDLSLVDVNALERIRL